MMTAAMAIPRKDRVEFEEGRQSQHGQLEREEEQ